MTPLELLEASKNEVDERGERIPRLWNQEGDACHLGCVGFARWGQRFAQHTEGEAYADLESDPVALVAVEAIADAIDHGAWSDFNSVERVWRYNESQDPLQGASERPDRQGNRTSQVA
jgi:hypothetical protein